VHGRKFRYVKQLGDDHCGAAALAMCCGVSYAKALAAIGRTGEPLTGEGANSSTLVAAALLLGHRLVIIHRSRRVMRLVAEQAHRAVLALAWKRGTPSYRDSPGGHFVFAAEGRIYDPSAHRHWKTHPEAGRRFRDYFRRRPGWVQAVLVYEGPVG